MLLDIQNLAALNVVPKMEQAFEQGKPRRLLRLKSKWQNA